MGLDITAYTQLKKIVTLSEEDAEKVSEFIDPVSAWLTLTHRVEDAFPGRAEGIEANTLYCFPYQQNMKFCAGSYGGYGEWRRVLAKLAGYGTPEALWKNYRTGPFSEMIHFSDCEGIIGPVVSAKLARDFEEFKNKIAEQEKWWQDLYGTWSKAFTMAADHGAVDFH